MNRPEEFVTVEELAERLKVHPRTIQRLVERRELSAVRIGRQWRFRTQWVEDWLHRATVKSGTSDQEVGG